MQFNPTSLPFGKVQKVFLAGSIEMGTARNWQQEVVDSCKDYPFVFFNPRVADWDTELDPTILSYELNNQIKWEQDHLEEADILFFFFQEKTISPISLLEYGQYHNRKETILVVEPKYFRRGNLLYMHYASSTSNILASLEAGIVELKNTTPK